MLAGFHDDDDDGDDDDNTNNNNSVIIMLSDVDTDRVVRAAVTTRGGDNARTSV